MTLKELQEKQSWSLEQKVFHSLEVIGSYVTRLGGCAIRFMCHSQVERIARCYYTFAKCSTLI